MTKETLRAGLIRTGLDVLALLVVLLVLWSMGVVWTRSRNGEIAYECVVFHQCPQVAPVTAPSK